MGKNTEKPPLCGGFSVVNQCLVPRKGLEPSRLAALPPEGSASTNSATWAGAAPLLAASHGDVNGGHQGNVKKPCCVDTARVFMTDAQVDAGRGCESSEIRSIEFICPAGVRLA
jgi:hypothetical protein